MLKICMFTENKKLEKGLRSIVDSYMYEKMISVEVKVFRDLKMLLKSDISGAILFIDDSDDKNAVKTAQILREHDHHEEIVIITDNLEHVYDAFKVNAYRVIRFPVAKADIFEVIDSFRKRTLSTKVIIVKNGAQRITITTGEIIYVVSLNRETAVVTKSGVIPTTVPLFQITAQLPEEYFFTCHRSYTVNMMHIRKVASGLGSMKMSNRDIVPISRRRKKEFMAAREAYIDKYVYTVG
ncbi:MAG: response regulator transcription factor [Clostridia bacterium]|nr:response regulator transcription factor [Clostridia bacterium]MBR5977027.1 response regulator transcription factor [Clostridia bacterium]